MMKGPHAVEALFNHFAEIDPREIEPAAGGADAARPQHLLDGSQQAIAILNHDAIKLLAFVVIHGARLQRFQVETDGGDGGFQLVRDGVDEGIVLRVAANLAYQKNRVEHHAADDGGHEQRAQHEQNAVPPVQQNPADVQQDNDKDKAHA